MKLISEFKSFLMRGNIIDLAVGIIIGAAFGKIVSSLVDDIIMPPLGMIIGGVDFKDLKYVLKETVNGAPTVAINYGMFIQNLIDFLIIAAAVFLLIKVVTTFRRKNDPKEPPTPAEAKEIQLLSEIRDLLKGKN